MLSLLGCYYISDDELAAAIQEHNVAAGPVSVASVEPAWGLTTGGEELVIRGKGFSEDVEVSFGGAVAEVTRASTDTLYVTAPAHEGEGEVDLAVSRGDIVGHLDGGYTYWADGEGLIGLVGSIWYFQKRGGYWSASEQDEANVQLRAISPVAEFDYSKSWAASLDTCEANPVFVAITANNEDVARFNQIRFCSAKVYFNRLPNAAVNCRAFHCRQRKTLKI